MIRRWWQWLSLVVADGWFRHFSRSRVARLMRAERRRFRATLTEEDRQTLARLVAKRSARGGKGVLPAERELFRRTFGHEYPPLLLPDGKVER